MSTPVPYEPTSDMIVDDRKFAAAEAAGEALSKSLAQKRTAGVVRRFAALAERIPTNEALFALTEIYRAAIEDSEDRGRAPEVPAEFRAAIAGLSDDRLGYLYAAAADATEAFAAPYRWAQNVAKTEFENRMAARRKERGPEDRGTISVPHPAVEIENKVDVTYTFDADSIREALRGLPDDEVAKLLSIEPKRTVYAYAMSSVQASAIRVAIETIRDKTTHEPSLITTLESLLETREIPERVTVRHTGALLAWLKKNAGSARAQLVAAAVTINADTSKTTLRPKAQLKRADPIVALDETEIAR